MPPGSRRPSLSDLMGGVPLGEQAPVMTPTELPPDFILAVEIERRVFFCAPNEYAQGGLGFIILNFAYRYTEGKGILRYRLVRLMGIPHIVYGCQAPSWWKDRETMSEEVTTERV